jgi:hypothetical protein
MTRGELKALVSYWLDDLSFGYFSETQVNLWLNNGLERLQRKLIGSGERYYTKCVVTDTVRGQREYVLPDDFRKIQRLELIISGYATTQEQRRPLTFVTLNQQDLLSTLLGPPARYTIRKNRIQVYPASDSNSYKIRLYYTYKVSPMDEDIDEPDAPLQYHELIALYACEDGFLKDGRMSEILLKKMKQYEDEVDRDSIERHQDGPREVVVTEDYGDSGGYYY